MRRLISVLIILVMACSFCCGCNKATTETSQTLTPESLFGPRYELWRADRTIALYDASEADVTIENYGGITADGSNFSSRFMNVLNTYRSTDIIFETDDATEVHHEYYDVDSDLLFLAITVATNNGDNTQSYEFTKYFIYGGTNVYLYDSANETYTPVDPSTVDCLTYTDVIATYGG